MKSTWILVVGAGLGVALASVPFWPSASPAEQVVAASQSAATPAAASCSKPAPDFTLDDMNGTKVSLAALKGKVVVLNFWATWCGPCKVEIPSFVKLQDRYRDRGVVFLGLSVDDPVEKLKPFADKYAVNYPLLVGLGHEDVQEAYGPIFGIPTTLVIDRRGLICQTHEGIATEEDLERDLKALM